MAQRSKCTTEFVQNDKARLATFRRRSHCLLKKASELSILCDVDVAVLIYPDQLSDRPLVFPPDSDESLRIIKKLKQNPRRAPAAKSKPDERLNQENHCKRPNDKVCDDITSFNVDELNSLARILDAKEAEVLKKIDALQRKNEAVVEEVSDPNRYLCCGDEHHSELFDQPHGFQGPISFSVVGNEDTTTSMFEQWAENSSGFMNQVSEHLNSETDPNFFFLSADDSHSALFDHQLSVMGKDNTPESNFEHFTENNSGLSNLITKHPNNVYYDELMSLDFGELDLAQILDAMDEYEINTIGENSNQMPTHKDKTLCEELQHLGSSSGLF